MEFQLQPTQDTSSSHRSPSSVPLLHALTHYVIPAIYKEKLEGVLAQPVLSQTNIAELAKSAMAADPAAALALVNRWLVQGLPLDAIYVQGVSGAAQLLGQWWDEDRVSFVDVTLGANRLQDLIFNGYRYLTGENKSSAPMHNFTILLAKPAASQHSLGLMVVSEIFRRHHWRVYSDSQSTPEALERTLAGEWVDVLGISVAYEQHIPAVAQSVIVSRRHSVNKHLCVMVGGPQVALRQRLAQEVGADIACADAAAATALAYQFVDRVRCQTGAADSSH